ncbi:MAG: GNAT family N-acetyltransferase [Bacteroidia bacterium]
MNQLKLIPITLKEEASLPLFASDDCQQLLAIYRDFYAQIGYHFPWVGYFVMRGDVVVGSCGYTGQPQAGKVEIAYWTFQAFEGQGIASFACKTLIEIARQAQADMIITAKTAPEHNVSTNILAKNGFIFSGIVQDHEIGDAWEWRLN